MKKKPFFLRGKYDDTMDKDYNIVLVGTGGQGVILASTILGWAALHLNEKTKVRTAETHGMAQRGGTVIVHLRFGPNVESPLVKTHSADVILSFELVEAIRYMNYLKPDGIMLVNNEIIIPPVLFRGQHVSVDPAVCIGCGNCRMNCYINTYYQDMDTLAIVSAPSSRIVNGKCEILPGCTGCVRCVEICNQNAIQLIKEISYPLYSEIEQTIKSASKNSYIIPASTIARELGDIRMTNIVMIGALLGFTNVPLKPELIKEAIHQILRPNVVEQNLKALETGQKLIQK